MPRVEMPKMVACPSCGQQVAWKSTACPNCGHDHPGQPKQTGTVIAIVVAVVLVIALVVVLVLVNVHNRHKYGSVGPTAAVSAVDRGLMSARLRSLPSC